MLDVDFVQAHAAWRLVDIQLSFQGRWLIWPIKAASSSVPFKTLASISAFGPARSTIEGAPLSSEELGNTDAYWRACCYLILGLKKSRRFNKMPGPPELPGFLVGQ